MKHRAAILSRRDIHSPAPPSAKEITAYFGKQAKLLYAPDKRQNKNAPYRNKHHLIIAAYEKFAHLFSPSARPISGRFN